jgi:4-amino-4-deoxy-L-arabinose transferase-like glycosyltransferase
VLSLWLFYELVREPHRVVWRVAFAAAFTFAILTKEISGLLGVAFVAFACIERFHRKRPLPLLAVAVPLAVAPLASVAIWALAAGGFGALRETLRIVLESPATNEFAIRWGSGPWYRYVLDQLVMSPWTTLLGIAAVAVVAWRWRTGRYDSLLVYCALLYVAQIAVLAPFTKNLRYVAVLEAPVRALAVVTICGALALERRRLALFAQAAVVAALCVVDFGVYDTFYLRSTLYDPVSAKILRMRSMVPRANQELTPAGTRGRNVRERGRGERDDTQR